MIQFTLSCAQRHEFDAWFRNAEAYEDQAARKILSCPVCGSDEIGKALMAPAVARKDDKVSLSSGHPEFSRYAEALRALRHKMTQSADYVGDKFAEEARKIHYAESEARGIYGEATREEAVGLVEEGIGFLPLPNLPEEHN